jgi:hypothetical protein
LRPGLARCVPVVIVIEFSSGCVMTASDRLTMCMPSIVRSLRGRSNVGIERHESESIFQPPYLSLRMDKCGEAEHKIRRFFAHRGESKHREQSA